MDPAADAHDDSRPADEAVDTQVYRLRRVQRRGVRIKGYRHTLEAVDESTGRVEAGCDVFEGGLLVALPIREGGTEDAAPAGRDGGVPGRRDHGAPDGAVNGTEHATDEGAPDDAPVGEADDGTGGEADRAMDGGMEPGQARDVFERFGGPRSWRLEPNLRFAPTRWTLHDPDGRVIVSFEAQALARAAHPLGHAALSVYDAEEKELYRLIDPRSGVAERVFGIGPDAWALVDGPNLVASLDVLPTQASSEPSRPTLLNKLGALLARPDRGLLSVGDGHGLPAPAVLCMVMLLDELPDTSRRAGAGRQGSPSV